MLTVCENPLKFYSIVTPDNANPAELHAAELLQGFLAKVLPEGPAPDGKHFIYVGGFGKCTDGIKYDGFRTLTDDKDVWLFGAMPRGTLYAVCNFAEKYLGYKRYTPFLDDVDPNAPGIGTNVDVIDNPVFELRRNDWVANTTDPDYAIWARINADFGDPKYGGRIESIGGCHTFESLCPPKQYFAEHPEYYSFYNGRRIPAGNTFDSEENAQLCLTNPDVVKIVTNNILERLRKKPDARIVELSQNDNNRYCQCPACAAIDKEEGSPSGTLLRFVNKVAEEVEKEFPDVLVQTFAYQYTRKPPRITKPRKNVMIRYCTIEACFSHPLADPNCAENAGTFIAELTEWGKLCDKISVWDYVTNYACYLAPFPNLCVIHKNLKTFADCNAKHIFEEDTPGTYTGELSDLRAYLMSKMMWNPYISDEEEVALREDFMRHFFGPGWENIWEYNLLMEKYTTHHHMHCFERPDQCLGTDPEMEAFVPRPYDKIFEESYLSRVIPHLSELAVYWDKTAAAAEDQPTRDRIARCRMGLDYLELFCSGKRREDMTDAQHVNYVRACGQYLGRKQKFNLQYNIWTQRAGH